MSNTATSHNRRFGGIYRLYGSDAFQRFTNAHICVIGVGGVGSWTVEALARSGIGHLTLIDLDNIAESNTNRQLHALSQDFGKAKVRALHERIIQINPDCQVNEIEEFIDENNLHTLLAPPFDFVIDAIDQTRIKAAIAAHLLQQHRPFVVSGSAGGQKNPALIQSADLSRVTHDRMLANLRYTLRKHYSFSRNNRQLMHIPCIYSTETVTPPASESGCTTTTPQGLSCAGYGAAMHITATFGLHCAAAALNHLAVPPL